MVRIRPFGVEQWMNEWETRCEWNLAETCVDSLTVDELLALAGLDASWLETLLPVRLGYGAIEGSDRLRAAIASLYETRSPAEVLVTHGAIGANHLAYLALVEPGDRVVSIVPTYQQHASIPEAFGADVRLLRLREEDGWLPDLDELRRLVDGHAKVIAFANPNNPTGALVDREQLEAVVAIARGAGAWILADEVYRGVDQDEPGTTASITDLYEKGVSVGSMSKAFSLAGLRLGWLAGPARFLHDVSVHRDYTTISVGMVDDALATAALEHADALLARSRGIVRENLGLLAQWVAAEPGVEFVRPRGGTIALLRIDRPLPSRDLCVDLLRETGVLMTPGSALDMEGYVRIGYANERAILEEGLRRTSGFLRGGRRWGARAADREARGA